MEKFPVYNLKGEKVEELELSPKVFGLENNDALLHQVFVAMEANQRNPIAHAKDRSERSGTGKKPHPQKGTGTARQGSSRSPLNRKGGVTFGPTKDRNFKKDVNKKMKQKATLLALSGKAKSNDIVIFSDFNLAEKKTKEFAKAFDALKIKGSKIVLFSEGENDLRKFCRNIHRVEASLAKDLSVSDLLKNKKLILSKDSIKFLEDKFDHKSSDKDDVAGKK
jgi:large subunit ribosomal protein L4